MEASPFELEIPSLPSPSAWQFPGASSAPRSKSPPLNQNQAFQNQDSHVIYRKLKFEKHCPMTIDPFSCPLKLSSLSPQHTVFSNYEVQLWGLSVSDTLEPVPWRRAC